MSNLGLRQRDAAAIAQIGKLRFSPLSLVGGRGNRLIEEGGRSLLEEVQKAVAARIQAHVLENVIYVPLGNWLNAQARSAKLTGMIPGPVTVFWNLEKAR